MVARVRELARVAIRENTRQGFPSVVSCPLGKYEQPGGGFLSPPGCRDGRMRRDVSYGKKQGSAWALAGGLGPVLARRPVGKGIRSVFAAAARRRTPRKERQQSRKQPRESRPAQLTRADGSDRGIGVRTSLAPWRNYSPGR